MKTRKTPLVLLKRCNINNFAKDIKSNDEKIFDEFKWHILNNELYIPTFFEKLKNACLEKKLTARDIINFLSRKNYQGYNLMQNIIIKENPLKKAIDLYWIFLDALQRNLLGNVLTNKQLCSLLLQPNAGRLSSYRLILSYPGLSKHKRVQILNIMSSVINKVATEKELIRDVLQTMFPILKSFSEQRRILQRNFIRNYLNLLRNADNEYMLQMKPLMVQRQSLFDTFFLRAIYNQFLSRCDAVELHAVPGATGEENFAENKKNNPSVVFYQEPSVEAPAEIHRGSFVETSGEVDKSFSIAISVEMDQQSSVETDRKSSVEAPFEIRLEPFVQTHVPMDHLVETPVVEIDGNTDFETHLETHLESQQKFNIDLINQIASIPFGHSYFAYPLHQEEVNVPLGEKEAKETVSDFKLPKYTKSFYLLFPSRIVRDDAIEEKKLVPCLSLNRCATGT